MEEMIKIKKRTAVKRSDRTGYLPSPVPLPHHHSPVFLFFPPFPFLCPSVVIRRCPPVLEFPAPTDRKKNDVDGVQEPVETLPHGPTNTLYPSPYPSLCLCPCPYPQTKTATPVPSPLPTAHSGPIPLLHPPQEETSEQRLW